MVLLLPGCSVSDREEQSKAISVGSTRVSLAEVKTDFKELVKALPVDDENRRRVSRQVLDEIVERYLILEYGKERRISLSKGELNASIRAIRGDCTDEEFREALLREYIEYDQWKEQLKKRLLVEKILNKVDGQAPPPTHTDIVRYYEEHSDSFHSERQIKFRQIVTRDKHEAEIALKRIRKGSDFGNLAREISIAPEASRGGMVGWVTQGQLEKSMDKALSSLKPGQLSPVVHSPYGYHIFEVVEMRPARTETLPEATKEIASKLLLKRRNVFLAQWLAGLKNRFDVYVNPNLLDLLES